MWNTIGFKLRYGNQEPVGEANQPTMGYLLIDGKKHDYFAILEDDETRMLCRPIAGRGLLVGSDAQGGDADVRTNILDLALMVKWAEAT